MGNKNKTNQNKSSPLRLWCPSLHGWMENAHRWKSNRSWCESRESAFTIDCPWSIWKHTIKARTERINTRAALGVSPAKFAKIDGGKYIRHRRWWWWWFLCSAAARDPIFRHVLPLRVTVERGWLSDACACTPRLFYSWAKWPTTIHVDLILSLSGLVEELILM